ncbi:MAG: LysR family transcriptional regulator [Alicyclobacillus sp.]|nr:LysR family transcriptional regulator [Alicyclobacillus sp.]
MDQHLMVFLAVAEGRNFSRAAEELHMTQPAVSLHVQALENLYGVRLLERTNKYVRLTPAGRILYEHGKQIQHQYALIKRLIDDLLENDSGPIAIGASYTFGEYILPHVIARFRARYPRIRPSVSIENTLRVAQGLLQQELDVGIVEGELHHPELVVRPFLDDTMAVVVPARHPLAGGTPVAPQQLAGETWIVREQGSGTREVTDRMFRETGIQPAALMEFGSTQVIKESVEAGLGISFLSENAIRKELALGTLRAVHIEGHPFVRHFSWVQRRQQVRTKALDLFLGYLETRDYLPVAPPGVKPLDHPSSQEPSSPSP